MSRLLLSLAFVLAAFPAFAETPSPLRCVPKQATFAIVVDNPRHLAEATLGLEAVKEAMALPGIREILDGTAVRRGLQLLTYLERETKLKWPELLDTLAGGGAVLAANPDKDVTLLVLQGTSEDATKKIFDLLVRIAEEEQARQGTTDAVQRTREGDVDVVQLNKETLLARQGATVLVSNKPKGMSAGLELLASQNISDSLLGQPTVAKAKKLLPKNPLAWFWVDFASVKEKKETKDFFETTRKEPFQLLVFGSTADCLRRSDYVAGGLFRDASGFRFSVCLPAGREGMPPEFALHIPAASKPGSLPLLEPPGVLYSQSFHLDLAVLWKERDKLLNDQVRKQLEMGEKNLSKFVPGVKLGELFGMWGGYHRVVVVNMDKPPYKTEPGQKLPAFGYVTSMADPQFGKSVEGLLRGAGFLFSLSQGIKLIEDTTDGVKVFGYRFPEDKPYPGDDANLHFNFEPSFAIVDDQFVAASTMELAKKLVLEVRRTAKAKSHEEVWYAKAYAKGVAEALTLAPDITVSDAILRYAVSLAEARQQVDQLAVYLRTLGTVGLELNETEKAYTFDVVWKLGNK